MGFSQEDLRDITRTAIQAAFCDEELRAALRGRV
jgi:adenosine deaminase